VTIAEFVYTILLKPRPLRRAANAAIRALLPGRIRVGEATVWLNPDDPVISGALTLGVYERGEIAYFRSRFGAGMTFIDIGANVGLYSALALSTPGFRGRVLAIEPHSESRLYLQKTIESNAAAASGAALVCGHAASDRAETLTLYKNPENKGDNRLYPDPLLRGEETVAADTLDNICRRYAIASAQFIKIDVQGRRGPGDSRRDRPARRQRRLHPDDRVLALWAVTLRRRRARVPRDAAGSRVPAL